MTGAAWLDPERVRSWSTSKLERERRSVARFRDLGYWLLVVAEIDRRHDEQMAQVVA